MTPLRITVPLLLACLALACGAPEEAPPLVQRLLAPGVRVALGAESRPASGPAAVGVFRGEVDHKGAEWRGFVPLPPHDDTARFVVLQAVERPASDPEPLQGPAPRRETVHVARVDRSGPQPRARLRLAEPLGEGASRLWVNALPLPVTPSETLRFPLAIPESAILRFGYGLREECWRPQGTPAEWRVALVDEDGARHPLFEAALDPRKPNARRWFDAEIDLAAWSGRRVTLEFTTTRRAGPNALSLPVWGDPTVYGPEPDDAPPDVVLISLDTLRARSLGAYGYDRDTSPFFDALAAEGTLFTRAITTAVSTSPSHMSLLTGLYPVKHGVLAGIGRRARGVRTLAEILRARGYTTAAFTENGYVDRARFGPGFGTFTENAAGSNRRRGLARLTFAQASDWLARAPRRPFLLFVHTYQVHAPYVPPDPYAELFRNDGVDGPDHAVLRRFRDDYDREIRLLDDQLRTFFAALDESGSAARSIAVVVADHGEEFGEHGRFQHGGAVFEEALRVPLLFWGPGRIPAGARHAETVSLIDVVPTLLELLEAPTPAGLDGTSLAAAIRDGSSIPRRTLFAEARTRRDWLHDFETARWETPLFAVVSSDAKFVVQRPEQGPRPPVLRYDLKRDPGEQSPQVLDAERAAEVNRVLDGYLTDPGPAPPVREDPDTLEPELRERLRALGYVE